ncbi:hypothetical protein N9V86_02595 [Opitutales bacterium]|nr:hypothetical protein [Opitutales bacterium]
MATITITPGNSFTATETVTSTKLNDLGSPTAALTAASIGTADIADDAITPALIADDAVTTPAILDSNVTFAKLTDVIDDDTMATATATTLATSESIKAYVDDNSGLKASTATGTITTTVANTFQDFDLSAVVGSNKAMVIMEVFDGNQNGRTIFFRTKGSSVSPYGASVQGGSNTALLGTVDGGNTVIVTTDSSGFLEVLTGGIAISNVKYAVQAFQVIS